MTYVQAESGAASASLGEGDVVTAVDGVPMRKQDDLRELLGARKVGEEVEVDLLRGEARAEPASL